MIGIDQERGIIHDDDGNHYDIGSPEAFRILSRLWLRSGWDMKYIYSFTWLGRPIIQLPEDMFRIQEVIYKVKPDIIVETGVAHGGSTIFYAGLCKAMDRGRVVSVDIEIRPHNRKALEEHDLFEFVTLIEGSSIDPDTVTKVKFQVEPSDRCIVILDSKHTKAHVLGELEAYSDIVAVGSYIIVQDGWTEWLAGAPRSAPDWDWNNPKAAVEEFIKTHDDFIVEEPTFAFNEGQVTERITACPKAFVKRVR